MSGGLARLRESVRAVPDFPKPGILFRDITPVLADPELFSLALELQLAAIEGTAVDRVLGVESRGFLFGPAIAQRLGVGFAPVRKPGKLPAETVSAEYSLEYGTDRLELHRDALAAGERCLIVDDLIATGGTAAATVQLVQALGGEVSGCVFLIELEGLSGRDALPGVPVQSVLRY